jgi:hypothetical protein
MEKLFENTSRGRQLEPMTEHRSGFRTHPTVNQTPTLGWVGSGRLFHQTFDRIQPRHAKATVSAS